MRPAAAWSAHAGLPYDPCSDSSSASGSSILITALLQPGLSLPPTNTLTDQTLAADGSYTLDLPNFTLPEDGIVYVNITGNDCTLAPNYPSGAKPSLCSTLACNHGSAACCMQLQCAGH